MKKIFSLLMVFTLIFMISVPVEAAAFDDEIKNTSFEVSLDEISAYIESNDIQTQNGFTIVPMVLEVNDEVYTEVVITIYDSARANAKSFSMEGWFKLKSNDEIVTVYGLDGTFEYTGSKATVTGVSTYHNSALKGWSGTSSSSTSEDDDGSATASGSFTCLKGNKVDNTASCSAKCTKSGSISFSGNYDESSIF